MFERRLVLLGMGSLGIAATLPLGSCGKTDSKSSISYANPTPVWWNAVPLIAMNRKLFAAEGLTLQSHDVQTGVKSKEALVDGNAMVGVCSPNAISITQNDRLEKLRIMGSIMQSSSTVAIVSRRPISDLAKMKIGYVPGAISEFYLIAFLQKAGLLDLYLDKGLSLTAMAPPVLPTALANKEVDAIVAWEPFAALAEGALRKAGEKVYVDRDESLYTQHILILSREDADDTALQKFVRTLKRTCEDVSADRKRAARELEEHFLFPSGFLSKSPVWDKVAFDFIADSSVITSALNRDLELAKIAKIAKATADPFPKLMSKLT